RHLEPTRILSHSDLARGHLETEISHIESVLHPDVRQICEHDGLAPPGGAEDQPKLAQLDASYDVIEALEPSGYRCELFWVFAPVLTLRLACFKLLDPRGVCVLSALRVALPRGAEHLVHIINLALLQVLRGLLQRELPV